MGLKSHSGGTSQGVGVEDFNWSPDSLWITYAQIEGDRLPLFLFIPWKNSSGSSLDGWFASGEPAFSSD
jgi:hypothetical protein